MAMASYGHDFDKVHREMQKQTALLKEIRDALRSLAQPR